MKNIDIINSNLINLTNCFNIFYESNTITNVNIIISKNKKTCAQKPNFYKNMVGSLRKKSRYKIKQKCDELPEMIN